MAIFGLPFEQDGKPLPFCAAGASYSAIKAFWVLTGRAFTPQTSVEVFRAAIHEFHQHFFKPSALVMDVVNDAKKRGKWIEDSVEARKTVQAGWLVAYQFGTGHHIEIVRAATLQASTLWALTRVLRMRGMGEQWH